MDLAEWTGLLQLSDNSQLSDYNFIKLFVKNKAVTAPITFEKIVMVMIEDLIPCVFLEVAEISAVFFLQQRQLS